MDYNPWLDTKKRLYPHPGIQVVGDQLENLQARKRRRRGGACKEDFTEWEQIGGGSYTVLPETVTFTDTQRQTTDSVIRLTGQTLKTVEVFTFDFIVSAVTLPTQDRDLLVLFTNRVASSEQMGLQLRFDATKWYVRLDGATTDDDTAGLTTGTRYFVTMTRSGTAIQAIIRTGSHLGTLVDTLNATTTAGELTGVLRGVLFHTRDLINDPTAKASGDIHLLCLGLG